MGWQYNTKIVKRQKIDILYSSCTKILILEKYVFCKFERSLKQKSKFDNFLIKIFRENRNKFLLKKDQFQKKIL
jgi:hypothetical protein